MSAKDMFYSKDKNFSRAEEKEYAREQLVYNVTEDILLVLEDLNISKKELARRLGRSRSYVTQLLSGARNMTLGSLSDICFALEVKPKVTVTVGSLLDNLDAGREIYWEEIDDSNTDDPSRRCHKTVNVIDCRDPCVWNQEQAA